MLLRVEESQGFRYLWLKLVTGFNPAHHCIKCLLGKRDPRVRPAMAPAEIQLDEGEVYYLCGVSSSYRWKDNLHLAVRRRPGEAASVIAYTGARFSVEGAVALPIPALPDGYDGRGRDFTTCRNYQFGVAHAELLRGLNARR